MLVLVAAGGGILHGEGQISLAAAVVAPGDGAGDHPFHGCGPGAHLNPAVSLAFAVRGDFPWKRVPGYIIMQLVGATLACLFLLAVLGNVEHLGATLPGPGYENWQAFLMEIALTGVLLQRDPRYRVGRAERRRDRRARGRWLHRLGRPVVRAGQRHLDESRSLVRPGAGQRRLDGLLGVCRRATHRRGDRCRLRDHPARPRWRPDLPRRRGRRADPWETSKRRPRLSRGCEEGKVVPPGLGPTSIRADP